MRHHQYKPDYKFIIDPIEFNRNTEKRILQYCLGATMYMPGTKDFLGAIQSNKYPGLTSIVMCFEDACREEDVPMAEENVLRFLRNLCVELANGRITYENIPLIFVRVRNLSQFERFAAKLDKQMMPVFTGFNFPKFNTGNAEAYFSRLRSFNEFMDAVVYGMPILEDIEIARCKTRMEQLDGVCEVLEKYRDLVLNVRVGATDFSSCFGVRRGIDYTIYDILTVRDILSDILNVFSQSTEYTISGPVWEYFRATSEKKFTELPLNGLKHSLLAKEFIVNDAVDGLLRELILDRANGFIGKTCIHPTHIKYINAMECVVREEYEDALQVLNTSGGVVKSKNSNKMNEIKPHTNWATKLINRARAYGVIENEASYFELFR
jgi:citrate lyase beta subunit